MKERFDTKVEAVLSPWKELITPLECISPPLMMIDLIISQHLRALDLAWRFLHGEGIVSDGHSLMWTTSINTLRCFKQSIVKKTCALNTTVLNQTLVTFSIGSGTQNDYG